MAANRRQHLTQKAVAQAKRGDGVSGTQLLWDDAPVGLALRLYASGRKAWAVYYRASRRHRWLTLGSADVMPLVVARKRARAILARVADGADPAAERRQEQRVGTLRELAERYMEATSEKKRSASHDETRWKKHLAPTFASRSALSITRAEVARWHRALGLRASEALANRCLALLGAMFTWGERGGALPAGTLNPARGVARFKEASRDRWLSRAEARRLLAAVNAEPSPWLRGFFWLLCLTGCRRSELLELTWDRVDLEGGTIRLAHTKQQRTEYVPLSTPAHALLEALPREQGNPYTFPGTKPGSHLSNVQKPWGRYCKAAKLEGVRIHDLRRSCGSWLAQSGRSLAVVGAVLGHSNASTTKVYARLAPEQAREALEAHGAELLAVAGQPAVSLPAASSGTPTATPRKRRTSLTRDSTAPRESAK